MAYNFLPCDRNQAYLLPPSLMEQKLLTERGRRLYKIRGKTVESVFGQIKDVRGFDKFMQRGIEAVAKRKGLLNLRKRPFQIILTCNFV